MVLRGNEDDADVDVDMAARVTARSVRGSPRRRAGAQPAAGLPPRGARACRPAQRARYSGARWGRRQPGRLPPRLSMTVTVRPRRSAPAAARCSGTRKRLEHIDAMRPVKQAGVVSTHTLLFFAPIGDGTGRRGVAAAPARDPRGLPLRFGLHARLQLPRHAADRRAHLLAPAVRRGRRALPVLDGDLLPLHPPRHRPGRARRGWAICSTCSPPATTSSTSWWSCSSSTLLFPLLLLLVRRTAGHHGRCWR